ncbi:MAG: ABC-type transport auxiliary lipoprotein family protein [Candidatus Binatia bacterium]
MILSKLCGVPQIVLAGVCLLAAGGCTVLPNEPAEPVRTYVLTLEPSASNPWPSCSSANGALLVTLPREQAGFNTTGIAYLQRPHEVKYYAYNEWAEPPSRLLVPLLVQGMEKTNCWVTVAQPATAVRADYRLDTEILNWQQEFFSNSSRVRLSLKAQLVDAQKREVMSARRFEIVEEAPTDDAYGAVVGINRAAARLLKEIAQWITKTGVVE